MNIKVGDFVYTNKGCRIAGNPGRLKVLKIGLKWLNYDAVLCKKINGKKRLFLLKNLSKIRKG